MPSGRFGRTEGTRAIPQESQHFCGLDTARRAGSAEGKGKRKEHALVREPSRAPLQKRCFQRMNQHGVERQFCDLDLRWEDRRCRWVRSVWAADPYRQFVQVPALVLYLSAVVQDLRGVSDPREGHDQTGG